MLSPFCFSEERGVDPLCAPVFPKKKQWKVHSKNFKKSFQKFPKSLKSKNNQFISYEWWRMYCVQSV